MVKSAETEATVVSDQELIEDIIDAAMQLDVLDNEWNNANIKDSMVDEHIHKRMSLEIRVNRLLGEMRERNLRLPPRLFSLSLMMPQSVGR